MRLCWAIADQLKKGLPFCQVKRHCCDRQHPCSRERCCCLSSSFFSIRQLFSGTWYIYLWMPLGFFLPIYTKALFYFWSLLSKIEEFTMDISILLLVTGNKSNDRYDILSSVTPALYLHPLQYLRARIYWACLLFLLLFMLKVYKSNKIFMQSSQEETSRSHAHLLASILCFKI